MLTLMGCLKDGCIRGFRASWIEIWEERILGQMALNAVGYWTIAADLTNIIKEVKVYWMINVCYYHFMECLPCGQAIWTSACGGPFLEAFPVEIAFQ